MSLAKPLTLLYPYLGVILSAARLFTKRSIIIIISLSSLDSYRRLKALSYRLQLLKDIFTDQVYNTCSNCFISSSIASP